MKSLPKFKLSKIIIADLQILGSAFFLGVGFLGQRSVSIYGLGPMTCNAFRFGLSTLLLAACLPLLPQGFGSENEDEDSSDDDLDVSEMKKVISINNSSSFYKILGPLTAHIAVAKKNVWFWGILLGIINFGGSGFQQWGISFTSASKVAFIAGFDLFLTPIFSMIIPTLKRNNKILPSTWLAIGISLFGLFFLSETSLDEPIGLGEILTLISTAFWTLYIIYTDIATNYVDSISLMCIQFGIVTILSAIAAFLYEPQQWLWDHFLIFLPWIVFLAFSEGVGFTLMAIGQTHAPPTHAAIILSLEGVFASIASYFFLGEHLSYRELFGCFLMLFATFVAKIGIPLIDPRPKTKIHKGDNYGLIENNSSK